MAPFTARWRQTVAAYDTHHQATAAVEILIRKGFPAEELSIVAEDVRRPRNALVRWLSSGSIEAGRYVVVCDGETADEAAALLRSSWRG